MGMRQGRRIAADKFATDIIRSLNLPGGEKRLLRLVNEAATANKFAFDKTEPLLEVFKQADKSLVARVVFNGLAMRNFNEFMQVHVDTGKILFDKLGPDFLPSYASEQKRLNVGNSRQLFKKLGIPFHSRSTNPPIVLFDPSVGDGQLTAHLARILGRQIYAQRKEEMQLVLMVNDISDEMLKRATSRIAALNGKDRIRMLHPPVITNVDFVDPVQRAKMGLVNGSVDVTLLAQTLDVIKGPEAKNRVLTACHDATKYGGRVVVVGEDPSLFTVAKNVDYANVDDFLLYLLFRLLFDETDKWRTEDEIKRTRDGRLAIVQEGMQPIRDEEHRRKNASIFAKIAEKNYRPSSKELTNGA
ncbi:MAG: class I SAM-dependent methyltransferase [Candidatus Micrarchaeota archaeon]